MLMTDVDLYQLRQMYPKLDIEPLTAQEERLIAHMVRGAGLRAAAKAVGMSFADASRIKSSPSYDAVYEYMRELKFGLDHAEVAITRNQLNLMLLDSHAKAATATEEIAAIRELGKMNDLYQDAHRKAGIEVQVNLKDLNASNVKRLSDQELIELSTTDYALEPSTEIVDDQSA